MRKPMMKWTQGLVLGVAVLATGHTLAESGQTFSFNICQTGGETIGDYGLYGDSIYPFDQAGQYMWHAHNHNDPRYKDYYESGGPPADTPSIELMDTPLNGEIVLVSADGNAITPDISKGADERYRDVFYLLDKDSNTSRDHFSLQIKEHDTTFNLHYEVRLLAPDEARYDLCY